VIGQEAEEKAGQCFEKYLGVLQAGDYVAAAEMWSLWDRTYSEHLGINYDNCPVKLESGTLLGRQMDALRDPATTVDVLNIEISRGFAKLSYSVSGSDSIGLAYINLEDAREPQLVSPLNVFAGNWEELPSEYFKLTYRDQSLVQSDNLDFTNDFILEAASRLALTPKEMALLEDRKLSIFLCESHGEVQQLTAGAGAWGYYQPGDAVVSRLLPDRAQITQLLIAFKMQSLPPATAPLLRYGTSTYFGGGYSRSASLALSLGKYIYLNGFSELDDLMSTAGFLGLESNPDFAYPVAGLFCAYLFNDLGLDGFLKVYSDLSGSFEEIAGLEADAFKQRLSASCGKDWPTIESEFHSFAESWQYRDLGPAESAQGELIYESGIPGAVVRIYEDSVDFCFEVLADSANFSVAILSRHPSDYSRYESFLFAEQFPQAEYKLHRLGVLLTPHEVGSYNYFTNEITGKYIVGLTGDTPLTSGDDIYRCRIAKKLLPRFDRSTKTLISTR
jgi:hypothetical protein